MLAILHIGKPTASGSLGLNAFNHHWTNQVSYVFPFPALIPLLLSKVQADNAIGLFRLLILLAPCWMEVPWLLTVLGMLADVPHWCLIIKRPCHGCFGRQGAQWSAVTAFNPLAAQRCLLHRQGFSSSVYQALVRMSQASTTKVYQQCWNEWASWCAREGVPSNAISAPKLNDFQFA